MKELKEPTNIYTPDPYMVSAFPISYEEVQLLNEQVGTITNFYLLSKDTQDLVDILCSPNKEMTRAQAQRIAFQIAQEVIEKAPTPYGFFFFNTNPDSIRLRPEIGGAFSLVGFWLNFMLGHKVQRRTTEQKGTSHKVINLCSVGARACEESANIDFPLLMYIFGEQEVVNTPLGNIIPLTYNTVAKRWAEIM